MAKKVRIRNSLILSEDGVEHFNFPSDTGNKTYTEATHGRFRIATTNTEVSIGIGQLNHGNFLFVKASTGDALITVKTAAATASNSITLTSGGFLVLSNVTFGGFRAKNKNLTLGTTIEYWICGD